MANQIEYIRAAFEDSERYLTNWRYSIRIRAETISEFVKGCEYSRILDIGCGDGSISIPLVRAQSQLTLLDISGAMLANARRQIPPDLVRNVELVNEDFLTAALTPGYDLILCIGVLAHVSSPQATVAKIGSLLSPGGCVIAESTDAHHLVTRLIRAYGRVRDFVRPAEYHARDISTAEIVEMFGKQGLELSAIYRYGPLVNGCSLPLPGMTHLLNQRSLYRLMRMLYGAYPRNRNAKLGNECIYRFCRRPTESAGTLR